MYAPRQTVQPKITVEAVSDKGEPVLSATANKLWRRGAGRGIVAQVARVSCELANKSKEPER
jgi:hypothetical protein